MAITLQAHGEFQEIILRVLNGITNPVLINKINTGDKTLADCEAYVFSEAEKAAKNGCAFYEDNNEVYGMMIHYFEEDSIKKFTGPKPKAKVTTSAPKKEQPKVEKPKAISTASNEIEGQLSLF